MWMIACRTFPLSHSFVTVFTYLLWLYYIAMLREQGNAQSLPYIEVILLYIAGQCSRIVFSSVSSILLVKQVVGDIDNPFFYSPFRYRVFSLEGSLVIDWLSERRPEHVVW